MVMIYVEVFALVFSTDGAHAILFE